MRVLVLTTLYPYASRPAHGVFVEHRIRALRDRGAEVRVIAPVPRFPFRAAIFGDYARYAAAPPAELRHGIQITHPRYLLVPRIGMTAAVHTLTRCFRRAIGRAIAEGFTPDLIDAHYYYPDGVAAMRAAQGFGLPVVITARGTDVNLIPEFPRARAFIADTAARASASITVAEALRGAMLGLGADPAKVTTIGNGVDLSLFAASPRPPRAGHLSLLSVGHLIERKGHDLIIAALAALPDARLTIVGGGPLRRALETQATAAGVADRVTFAGELPQTALPDLYRAADMLVLASSREGWPNVLLEALACGTRCVATPVWGSPEVIAVPAAGQLSADRTPAALAAAIRAVAAIPANPAATRAYAEGFSWDRTAARVETVWDRALKSHRSPGFGIPAAPPALAAKRGMVLTIDTEECFDWHGGFTKWEVPPADSLATVQRVAERHGFRPLYFVTYPLLMDDAIAALLRGYLKDGRADVGLHLHSWSTPPGPPIEAVEYSFQCNIDPALHQAKLTALQTAFVDRLGIRADSHRAGRYGIAPHVLDQLAAAGVLYDFSPSVGFEFRAEGGPDFTSVSPRPHRRRTADGVQWVIPVSGARFWRGTSRMVDPSHFAGARRAALLRRVSASLRLTPEGVSLPQMQLLTRVLARAGVKLLTPSLHVSTLVPGMTPYGATAADVDRVLTTLDQYLGWAVAEGWAPLGLPALRDTLARA